MDEMDKPDITRRDYAKLFLFYAIASGAAVVLVWVLKLMGDDRITWMRAMAVCAIPAVFALISRYLYLTSRCAWASWTDKQCPVTAEPGSRYCRAHNPVRGF